MEGACLLWGLGIDFHLHIQLVGTISRSIAAQTVGDQKNTVNLT